jgi:hypothetical protein
MRDGWVTLQILESDSDYLDPLDSRNIGSELPVLFTRHDSNHVIATTDDFTCMISIHRGLISIEQIDSADLIGFSTLVPFIDGSYLSQSLSMVSVSSKSPSSFSLLFTYPIEPSERPLQIAKDLSTGLVILTSTSRVLACTSSGDIVAQMLLPQEGIPFHPLTI